MWKTNTKCGGKSALFILPHTTRDFYPGLPHARAFNSLQKIKFPANSFPRFMFYLLNVVFKVS